MRRSQWLGVACLTTCLMIATAAKAQGQGGRGRGGRGGFGGGFGFSSAMLIRNEKVQEELKITDEQKEKLAALPNQGGGRARGGRGGGQDQSDEDREKAFAEMRKRIDESNKMVESILDASQLKRLKEISLQARGNGALADEEVATALKLTDDQKEAVKTIQDESGKRMRELRDADPEERRQKFAELRKDTDEEYLAVLTDEQKAKFAEMKGAKIDIDFTAGFGGRGPGGGRRRGGNNN